MTAMQRYFIRFVLLLTMTIMLSCSSQSKSDSTKHISLRNLKLKKIYPNIVYVKDILYKKIFHHKHTLDIYYKKHKVQSKVIIFIHGGAWKRGDKLLYAELGYTFSHYYNFTTVIINYRLSNSIDGKAIFPDHLNDVSDAIKWVIKHIKTYGGDPGQLFLLGHSAGAHLASLFIQKKHTNINNNIKGVILVSGQYQLQKLIKLTGNDFKISFFDAIKYRFMLKNAFGSIQSDILKKASPNIRKIINTIPVLLLYSEKDIPGADFSAKLLLLQLKANKVKVKIKKFNINDFSKKSIDLAAKLGIKTGYGFQKYTGHFAEIISINTKEHKNIVIKTIVTFINSY